MRHRGGVSVIVACVLGATIAAQGRADAVIERSQARAVAPVHSISIGGAGAAAYPAFDPAITRYAVTTTEDTGGTVQVTATTSDPAGVVRIDGRPTTGPTTTVQGLRDGDEISVLIDDAGGSAAYSLVYLPAGFPTLERVTPLAQEPTKSHVLLDLSNEWTKSFPDGEGVPDFFDTAVDANGVPAYVAASPDVARVLDFQLQPNGLYSMARPTTTRGRTGEALYTYDKQMRPVGGPYETVGLTNTDGHDAIFLPDGTHWLMAYEHNAGTGKIDSVIQHIDATGHKLFTWTSAPYADETVLPPTDPDYAHINSFELVGDHDLLVSFRNLSAVYLIDTSVPGGQLVWKLGGRDSDFAITGLDGLPDGGPCAQHTARMMPDGDIAVYDDGSNGYFGTLCIDPVDPTGPAVPRLPSRAMVMHLDIDAHTARIVREYGPVDPGGRKWFSLFAGSTIPLPNSHLMVGWAAETGAIATELDTDDQVVWELRDPNPVSGERFFSYRSQPADFPDAVKPAVAVARPAAGAVYREGQQVVASFGCTDRGGSSLRACEGTDGNGVRLDTTVGRHTYRVIAVDGAGNRTQVTRHYRVRPDSRPDALVREGTGRFVGNDRYGAPGSQRVTAVTRSTAPRVRLQVRLQNDGVKTDRIGYRITLAGAGHRRAFTVAGRDGAVRVGPGRQRTVTIVVRRTARAHRGDVVVVRVRATGSTGRTDGASAKVTAR